ncbi:MAG: DUF4145 domain-containing protein [Pseudanabaena frigida]|uniref:DUF4145 domain-containing protein n=1 Tax=Pseudanabaena frigida TaxID=945775 RepID=A0A2W4WFZ5_9CYAN|nr:MAG: DUF4145 domain-containing protein [Pseudanabaena frigida]
MTLPINLQKKYIDRFDVLITQGEVITQKIREDVVNHRTLTSSPSVMQWKTCCISLLSQVLKGSNAHKYLIEEFEEIHISNPKKATKGYIDMLSMSEAVGKLKAIKDDFENGFLANLSMQIEAEISANYMEQAEQLLIEGKSGAYDHVPAAVLTGAVLEKSLRTLCDQQNPPIHTFKTTAKGSEPLTLNPLIDELKKAALFNELKAKQLRAWADIRNAAAHGEFDKFSRSDVEQMIEGVKNFLATYML